MSEKTHLVLTDSPEIIREAITYGQWSVGGATNATLQNIRTGDILFLYSLGTVDGLVAFATITDTKRVNDSPPIIEFDRRFSLPFVVWESERIQLSSPKGIAGISLIDNKEEITRIYSLMKLRWSVRLPDLTQASLVKTTLFPGNKCAECGKQLTSRVAQYCEDCRAVVRKRQVREWNRKNKDQLREANKRWREKNPDKIKEYRRKWAKHHKETIRYTQQRREAKECIAHAWAKGLELERRDLREMSDWCKALRGKADHISWILRNRNRTIKLAEIEDRFSCFWEDKLKVLFENNTATKTARILNVRRETVILWASHLGLSRRRKPNKNKISTRNSKNKSRVKGNNHLTKKISGVKLLLGTIDPGIRLEFLNVNSRRISNAIRKILFQILPSRQAYVLKKRYLISDYSNRSTLRELGSILQITCERVRQLEQEALVKLRHPSNLRLLKQKLARVVFDFDDTLTISSPNRILDLETQVKELREKLNVVQPQQTFDLERGIYDKLISEFKLSVRANNCLLRMGVRTVKELAEKTESELMDVRNLGRKTLSELKSILDSMGLSFRKPKSNITCL